MHDEVSIGDLVRGRMAALGLDRRALVVRMGYGNTVKGLRRVDAVLAGNLETALAIRDRLGAALGIAPDAIAALAARDEGRRREAEDRAMLESFRPHAIAVMEKSVPSPIFVAAFAGSDRRRRIDIPEDASPVAFATIARRALPDCLPGFGRTVGFIVNYAHDRAVRFDLEGRPLETLDRAVPLGRATLALAGSGRTIAPMPKGSGLT